MNVHLNIQPEKLPFFLELIQQFDFVEVIHMENTNLAQAINALQPNFSTIKKANLTGDVADLQSEIDGLMG